jgi:ATP-binding cassette, subfamily D (ALD), member 2
MSFSKLKDAASRIHFTKTKVATGVVVAGCAAYGLRKLYPSAFDYVFRKTGLRASVYGQTSGNGNVSIDGSLVGTSLNAARTSDDKKQKTISVNALFFKQLRQLLKIIIPGLWTKEFALLVFHTLSLVSRTFLSIYVAQLDGHIVKSIVQRDVRQFILNLLLWLSIAIPATFVNSLIRFLECQLGLALRSRLVRHAYDMYFRDQTYYRFVRSYLSVKVHALLAVCVFCELFLSLCNQHIICNM